MIGRVSFIKKSTMEGEANMDKAKYTEKVLPGKTHCVHCLSKLPEEVGMARVCHGCDKDPYKAETEEEVLSRQTGERVKRILIAGDEEADRVFVKKHIQEFKEKMGW